MAEVQALTRIECDMMGRLLAKHKSPIYSDIWQFGLNVPLRISDLLDLKMNCVLRERNDEGEMQNVVHLVETKTRKSQKAILNQPAMDIIKARQELYPDHEYLFQSTSNRAKSLNGPINRSSVYRAFNDMGTIIGRRIGCHTTRKSRGKALYDDGVPIEIICKLLNHSSTRVTLSYIGIEQKDVDKTYSLEIHTKCS